MGVLFARLTPELGLDYCRRPYKSVTWLRRIVHYYCSMFIMD